jgi:hypothetical protein
MKDKLEKISKKPDLAQSRYCPGTCMEELKKNHQEPSQNTDAFKWNKCLFRIPPTLPPLSSRSRWTLGNTFLVTLHILCRHPGTTSLSKKLLHNSGETTRSVKCITVFCDTAPHNLIDRWGRVVAQAISRWLPTAAARVRVRPEHMGFMVDKTTLGQIFPEYFGFSCQSSFH